MYLKSESTLTVFIANCKYSYSIGVWFGIPSISDAVGGDVGMICVRPVDNARSFKLNRDSLVHRGRQGKIDGGGDGSVASVSVLPNSRLDCECENPRYSIGSIDAGRMAVGGECNG